MGQYNFKLPDIGEGTVEAEIAGWRVKVGDRVEEDQPLVDMMTDKATVELTSPVSGVIRSVGGEAGQVVAVGSVLVVFDTQSDESAVAVQPPADSARNPAPSAAAPPAFMPPSHSADRPTPASSAPTRAGRVLTSPAVRRRAKELGVDLQLVQGSGPNGRIVQTDLDAHIASASGAGAEPAPGAHPARRAEIQETPVIGVRRQIAERMQLAKRQIPHFSYIEEVDVTELENLRAHLNAAKRADQPRLTVLPFFMRALVRVLPEFPQMNALYDDEAGVVRRYAPVHIGIATQTPRGLMVPVVHHAQALDLWECAAEVLRVAAAAREGKATRQELAGSTITITSLGPLGGLAATPVINRPEVAILGPNKIVERPVVRDGRIVVRKTMNLSSSFDHRVVDGAEAAEFIQRVRAVLEHPAALFIT